MCCQEELFCFPMVFVDTEVDCFFSTKLYVKFTIHQTTLTYYLSQTLSRLLQSVIHLLAFYLLASLLSNYILTTSISPNKL